MALKWSLNIRAWKPSPVVSRFVRKVRTASGAVAVQIVTRRGRSVEQVEHLGSARTDADLALLLSAARDRLSPGQDELDLGDLPTVPPSMDEVADWTSKRRPGGQALLDTGHASPAAPRRRGRPLAAKAGGRVVATSSLVNSHRFRARCARRGLNRTCLGLVRVRWGAGGRVRRCRRGTARGRSRACRERWRRVSGRGR